MKCATWDYFIDAWMKGILYNIGCVFTKQFFWLDIPQKPSDCLQPIANRLKLPNEVS